jgi:hypothetical protein
MNKPQVISVRYRTPESAEGFNSHADKSNKYNSFKRKWDFINFLKNIPHKYLNFAIM